jgi:hypothetical protein
MGRTCSRLPLSRERVAACKLVRTFLEVASCDFASWQIRSCKRGRLNGCSAYSAKCLQFHTGRVFQRTVWPRFTYCSRACTRSVPGAWACCPRRSDDTPGCYVCLFVCCGWRGFEKPTRAQRRKPGIPEYRGLRSESGAGRQRCGRGRPGGFQQAQSWFRAGPGRAATRGRGGYGPDRRLPICYGDACADVSEIVHHRADDPRVGGFELAAQLAQNVK